MKKVAFLLVFVIIILVLIIYIKRSTIQKRKNYLLSHEFSNDLIDKMSESEINDSYVYLNQRLSGIPYDSIDTELKKRILIIGSKYNIFT